MNIHKNARLTAHGRERIARQIAGGQTPQDVSAAAGVCPRTVRKWARRHKLEGAAGLQDRSSRPHRLYRPTPQAIVERIERLRRERLTGKAIAADVAVSPATVSRILKRLNAAVAYYESLGVKIERVMTDNGACPIAFRKACKRLGLRHIRTRPYTPKTNGKAERFIQTSLRECAYARAYNTSRQRAAELPHWMHQFNLPIVEYGSRGR